MRDYNVALHHPHPPGFPAYIGIAHVARFFTGSDFHALQIVNLVFAMLVFPAMYLLARLDELSTRLGPRFTPNEPLKRLAERDGKLDGKFYQAWAR